MWNGVDDGPEAPSLQMVNVIDFQILWCESPVFGDESGCGLEWCGIFVLSCQL